MRRRPCKSTIFSLFAAARPGGVGVRIAIPRVAQLKPVDGFAMASDPVVIVSESRQHGVEARVACGMSRILAPGADRLQRIYALARVS